MKPIPTDKRHLVLLSLLLFAVMQYSALLHASSHYFHTPDNQCSIYGAIEHNKTGLITHSISVSATSSPAEHIIHDSHIVTTAYYIFLPSRAPPRA